MEQILEYVIKSIQEHGTIAMFFGGLIEQIIVPIPSPIITMAGGAFLVSHNSFSFNTIWEIITQVSIPYSIGATIGSSLVFLTAYFGGKPLVDTFGKHIGISWSLIEKIKSDFQKTISDELFILISCSIPVVPVSLISAFCGSFRIQPVKFYSLVFVALLLRSTILGFVGYQMGETFIDLAHGLDKVESLLSVAGAGLILGYLYLQREKWLKKNQ